MAHKKYFHHLFITLYKYLYQHFRTFAKHFKCVNLYISLRIFTDKVCKMCVSTTLLQAVFQPIQAFGTGQFLSFAPLHAHSWNGYTHIATSSVNSYIYTDMLGRFSALTSFENTASFVFALLCHLSSFG